MSDHKYIPITDWDEDDRPREKLLKSGRQGLSDSELLAIILGSGSRDKSAVDLAKEILKDCNNNLDELGKVSIESLMNYKGVGEAKAIKIAAVLELGRRRQASQALEKQAIRSSHDAYETLRPILSDLAHEEFWILILNTANKVIRKERISSGGINATIADPRIIFKLAIRYSATSIILAHNHPSGSTDPSKADIKLTQKLQFAGKHIDILILDHIIVGDNSYFSFKDSNLIINK